MIKLRDFSLRIQLMLTFVLCLFIGTAVSFAFELTTREQDTFITYEPSQSEIKGRMTQVREMIADSDDRDTLAHISEEAGADGLAVIYICDPNGAVLARSQNAAEAASLNFHQLLSDTQAAIDRPTDGAPYALLSAEKFEGKPVFVVVKGELRKENGYTYTTSNLQNWLLLSGAFIGSFYLFTSSKMRQIRRINRQLGEIAAGRFDFRLDVRSKDELGVLSANINKMAESLERLIKRDRMLEKSKMDLITGVSHDLRTPLTSIIGYLDLLRSRSYANEGEHDRFVRNTYSKTVQLKKLIDDLFEYTRLTSGEFALAPQTLDLNELLGQMLAEFEPIAKDNGVTVAAAFAGSSLRVHADSEKLMRAVDNLLMNALKFSVKPGVVAVSAEADLRHAVIRVENRGDPITKEQEERLFDRFFKVDPSRNAPLMQEGSGLGLSIAKQIVEVHGGTIGFTYVEGWFIFAIRLPLLT